MGSREVDQFSSGRQRGTALIQHAGVRLQLPQMTLATACVLFHRFFAKVSMNDHDPIGKSEETPRRLRDVINTVYRWTHPGLAALEVSAQFWEMKEALMQSERLLLRTIAFNVDVVKPHSFAMHFLRDLKASNELANCTFSLLNDCMRIPICLAYEPHVIACGALYLATELLSERTGEGDDEWWDRFGAHRTEIEEISHALLDSYESNYSEITATESNTVP